MKTIDTKAYLDAVCEIAQTGNPVSTIVSGSSMAPFLASNRDYVFLEVPSRPLKKGDIVLFQRTNGNYILHRIKKVTSEGYYIVGDRQTKCEGPVPETSIRCVVTSAKRKDKLITPENFSWKFYEKVWINLIFLRPAFFSLMKIFRKKHKNHN